MKKNVILIIMVCLSIIFTVFSGCIDQSYRKTETVITKLDSSDKIQWTRVIDNTGYSTASSSYPSYGDRFIETSDNGFFIVGSFSDTFGGSGVRILKIDSGGNIDWEKRIPGYWGDILALIQREDGGYSVFTGDGVVYSFDASGTMERTTNIPGEIHQTPVGMYPGVSARSIARNSDGNISIILTGGRSPAIWKPVITIASLSENGKFLGETIFDMVNLEGTTSLIQTHDGGFLLGKKLKADPPGDEMEILIEKTDTNTSIGWNSTLCVYNLTYLSCDLLGLHESEDHGYDVIFQATEQGNPSGDTPVEIIYAHLDSNGKAMQQEVLTNVSELPRWFFDQRGSSYPILTKVPVERQENPHIEYISLLKTVDGGYALLGTRYYEYYFGVL